MAVCAISYADVAIPLVDLGHQLLTTFPGRRVFGVGNSPAFPLRAMQIEAEVKGQPFVSAFLPFSGSFCRGWGHRRNALWFIQNWEQPALGQILGYRKILTERGASPSQIVSAFRKEGSKTLFFDLALTGKGLVSFLSILFPWAKEVGISKQFNKAVEIAMVTSPIVGLQGDAFVLQHYRENKRLMGHPLQILEIDGNAHEGLALLEKLDFRLTPSYSRDLWKNPPPRLDHDSGGVRKLEAAITDLAKARYASAPSAPTLSEKLRALPRRLVRGFGG